VALYKAWVDNTWLTRDLSFRIIVPLESFNEQQILRVSDDALQHTRFVARLKGCYSIGSIA